MKALVLLSGGIDSTTCLALAVDKYGAENVVALSVSYGQKHEKEVLASNDVASYYGVTRYSLDLSEIFKSSDCALLKSSGVEIPKESYAEQLGKTDGKPVSTYVPFRNGLFLASAASIAVSLGCTVIYYGAHADDAAGNAYPDCSEAFDNAMSKAIEAGTSNLVRIEAPFIGKKKTDVVREGLRLHAPYHLTWSCYEGKAKPCGKCGTCLDRIAAFRENGVDDPADYEV